MYKFKSTIEALNKQQGNRFYMWPVEVGRISLDENGKSWQPSDVLLCSKKKQHPKIRSQDSKKPVDLNTVIKLIILW